MRLDRREESQGSVVRQALVDGINGVIVPPHPEMAEQLIDVREAKLIEYPRLGALLLEHRRVWFHPQVNAHLYCLHPRAIPSSRAAMR